MHSSKHRSHRSHRSQIAAAGSLLLVTAWSSIALATPGFPDDMKNHLKLDATPACSVCHEGQQKKGTVTTAFGVAMTSRGLVEYDTSSLTKALDALDAEKSDVDGDGTTDIDALKAGKDPNGDGVDVAKYGCNNVSGQAPQAGAWLAFALGLLALRRTLPKPSPE